MITLFGDEAAKAKVQAECDKRNLHKGKHHALMMWKPLWTQERGWHPEFRRAVEVESKKGKVQVNA